MVICFARDGEVTRAGKSVRERREVESVRR